MKRIFLWLLFFPVLLHVFGCGRQAPASPADIQALIDRSRRLVSEQEYDGAMDAALHALTLAGENGDPVLKTDALCAIASVDLQAMRDAQAWTNACSAEELARQYHLDRSLCEALILKGRVCSYAGISEETSRDDEALRYLQEAYLLSQEKELDPEHIQACFHLSEVYVNKNRWNENLVPEYYRLAGEYLNEGERLAAADSLTDYTRKSIAFRFRYLRQGGNIEEAVEYCEKYLFMSDPADWLARQQIYDQLTVLYSNLGEAEMSVENHRRYVYAMQQYIHQKSDSRLQELEDQYAFLVKEQRSEQTRRSLIAMTILFILVLVFFFQSLRYGRKIRHQNEALAKADASKKNLLEAISSDLVDVTSLPGVNEMMELARNSFSMDEAGIRSAVTETVGKSTTLNDDVIDYFCKIILHRKKSVELSGLTERELEILRLTSQGLSAASIADMLHISPRTVTNHKQNIYTKMGVKSTPEMIYKAKEAGLCS
jgi:DNA-binding CsgD family transcriptional regulator